MRIMGKVIHLLRSSSILVSNGRYYLYWTLHTPATGRRKKKMSDLLKSLLGSFTLCLVLQDDKQIASETLNKLLEVTGVENQNKSLEEETTSAQPFSFPTEDPTKWNYSILALTFVTLFLAFLILVLNSRANKRRKDKAQNEAKVNGETETDSTEKKMIEYILEVDDITKTDQVLPSKQPYISMNPVMQTSSPKTSPKPGQILVEWKDGNISSLFMDGEEDDV
ncbi:organic solute transporter subunit beta isoform X2 [Narcine bancroftii]